MAWTLLNPAVTSTIIGVRTPDQLSDNLAALEVTLGAEQVAALDTASRVELGFPHDMLDGAVADMMFGGVNVARRWQ